MEDLRDLPGFVLGFFKDPRYCYLGLFISPREREGVLEGFGHGVGKIGEEGLFMNHSNVL